MFIDGGWSVGCIKCIYIHLVGKQSKMRLSINARTSNCHFQCRSMIRCSFEIYTHFFIICTIVWHEVAECLDDICLHTRTDIPKAKHIERYREKRERERDAHTESSS